MIKVWDPFIRGYHWALVAIVVSNQFINNPSENWHGRLGYLAVGLIGIRFLWGFFSNFYSRWSSFFPTITRIKAYYKLLRQNQAPRMLTHNPFAALAMIAMLGLICLLGLSGWMMTLDSYFGELWLQEIHSWLATGLLSVIGLHIFGVIHESYQKKENLIGSMFHGKKKLAPCKDEIEPS